MNQTNPSKLCSEANIQFCQISAYSLAMYCIAMHIHTTGWAGKGGRDAGLCAATKSPQALKNLPGSRCRLMPSWHLSPWQLEASATGKLVLEMVKLTNTWRGKAWLACEFCSSWSCQHSCSSLQMLPSADLILNLDPTFSGGTWQFISYPKDRIDRLTSLTCDCSLVHSFFKGWCNIKIWRLNVRNKHFHSEVIWFQTDEFGT